MKAVCIESCENISVNVVAGVTYEVYPVFNAPGRVGIKYEKEGYFNAVAYFDKELFVMDEDEWDKEYYNAYVKGIAAIEKAELEEEQQFEDIVSANPNCILIISDDDDYKYIYINGEYDSRGEVTDWSFKELMEIAREYPDLEIKEIEV